MNRSKRFDLKPLRYHGGGITGEFFGGAATMTGIGAANPYSYVTGNPPMNKTIDMNGILNASLNASWPRSQGMKTISLVIGCAEGATSDWDEGAGEDWGRILLGRNSIAFVWVKGPFVIIVSDISDTASALRDKGLYVVAVPSMDSECYDEIRRGSWNPRGGGGNDYLFFRQAADVVVTKSNGEFVTILAGGQSNGWFNAASPL